MIYKICSEQAWAEAQSTGVFAGAEIDIADGFIHFSAAHQVKETAAKHFSGQYDLVLLYVNEASFGEELKWEVSRGGDRFPHLFGPLPVSCVHQVKPLPFVDGLHQFPDLTDDKKAQ